MKNPITSIFFISIIISSCDKPNDDCRNNEINENCICSMVYAPVCGCDGQTYGNSCEANCAGVDSYTEGECR